MFLIDQIIDHGQSSSCGFNTCDNVLPRSLRYQLLLAGSIQSSRPEVAFSLAAFVIKMSASIPQAYEIYRQATAFTSVGVIQSESLSNTFCAICLRVNRTESVPQSRVAAPSCRQKFMTLTAQQDSAADTRAMVSTAIDAAADAE